jgi:hypothetical protein
MAVTDSEKVAEEFLAEKAETDDIETTDARAAVFGNEPIENVRRVPRYEAEETFRRTGVLVPEALIKPDNAEVRSAQPPVLALEDGKLLIKITHDNRTVVAEIGDGRWFFAQIVEKLLDPALLAQHQAVEFAKNIRGTDA